MILWELVAREVPFSNYPFQYQVEDAINKGIRPSIPDNCWDDYATLIKQSWAQNPNERPTFDQIVNDLLKMIWFHYPNKNFPFYQFDVPLPTATDQQILEALASPRGQGPSSPPLLTPIKAASSPNLGTVVRILSFLPSFHIYSFYPLLPPFLLSPFPFPLSSHLLLLFQSKLYFPHRQ